jgi:hypothetical protein
LDIYGLPTNWPFVAENKAILNVLEGLCTKFHAPIYTECFEQLTVFAFTIKKPEWREPSKKNCEKPS